jgi:hypothetical protein
MLEPSPKHWKESLAAAFAWPATVGDVQQDRHSPPCAIPVNRFSNLDKRLGAAIAEQAPLMAGAIPVER